jgi:hypothetical protein
MKQQDEFKRIKEYPLKMLYDFQGKNEKDTEEIQYEIIANKKTGLFKVKMVRNEREREETSIIDQPFQLTNKQEREIMKLVE